jgi:hypothetical protein
MYCQDCTRWDPQTGRCRDSKLNPQTWEEAVSVAQVLRIRSICVFNDFRERLIRAREVGCSVTVPKPRRSSSRP